MLYLHSDWEALGNKGASYVAVLGFFDHVSIYVA